MVLKKWLDILGTQAFIQKSKDFDNAHTIAHPGLDGLIYFNAVRWFDTCAIHFNVASFARIDRGRASPENPNSPKPFVNSGLDQWLIRHQLSDWMSEGFFDEFEGYKAIAGDENGVFFHPPGGWIAP